MNQNPKAIANLILDVSRQLGRHATNLTLNKIAYFAHGLYLARYDKPLIDAKIEAWEFGPVFREIYHEFKKFGDKPVTSKAMDLNLDTGELEPASWSLPSDQENFLREIITSYLGMSASYLVKISHLTDSPWYDTWYYNGRINPGMEISNDQILKYFSAQVRH